MLANHADFFRLEFFVKVIFEWFFEVFLEEADLAGGDFDFEAFLEGEFLEKVKALEVREGDFGKLLVVFGLAVGAE